MRFAGFNHGPDAVTQLAELKKASSYGQVAEGVEALVNKILGKDLPVGITEWNYDPGNPPPAYGDDPNFITRFSTNALHSMAIAGVAFACQFDIASYSGYGRLDMFDIETNQPKPQYYALKNLIQLYRPSDTPVQALSTRRTMGFCSLRIASTTLLLLVFCILP